MQEIYAGTLEEWKAWFEKNHDKETKVALISYKKHTGKPSLSHQESMGEAICWGWIDTTLKRLDEDRYIRHFAKRTNNSKWSNNTLKYGKKLIEEGRMTKYGLKRYKEGLAKPTHDHGIPKNPDVPDYLKKALSKHKIANENFNNLAPSYKKAYLRWLLSAKRQETIDKRVKIIIERLKENKKLF